MLLKFMTRPVTQFGRYLNEGGGDSLFSPLQGVGESSIKLLTPGVGVRLTEFIFWVSVLRFRSKWWWFRWRDWKNKRPGLCNSNNFFF